LLHWLTNIGVLAQPGNRSIAVSIGKLKTRITLIGGLLINLKRMEGNPFGAFHEYQDDNN
jgi:hypothetical protein